MAAERSSVKKRAPTGYMTFLASAPCEWILIFLLFVYAALTYFLTKFAQFCELKPPCLLCSRLDHVFGEKKSGCYWSSSCSTHREEISTLVHCGVHDKLVDVNGMCEECFLPSATGNKSNSEYYRLLVGKLWVDVERSALQSLMFNKHIKYHFSGRRTCSCCNKTWGAIFNTERFLGFGSSVGIGASKANVKLPLPRVLTRSRFSRRDSLKRLRDKFTGTMSQLSAVSSSFDALSHVGYAKPKISPDSESEAMFFEDEGGNSSTHGKNGSEHEYDGRYDRRGLPRAQGNELALESKSNQGYDVKPLVLDALNLLDLCENKNTHFSSSDAFEEQGLRELNWAEYYHKPSKYLTGELDTGKGSLSAPAETSKSIVSIPQTLALPVLSELPLYNASTLFSTMTIPDQHIEAVAGTSSDTIHPSKLNDMNTTDVSTRGTENKELTSTHALGHDYAENEEMESLIEEFSTSEVGSSSKVTSPSASDKHYAVRTDEIPILASLGRNDSDHHESSDGISDGDIIGEGIVDRLKRQVEHDQICISSLHQELEAERSAATIAANQAMAMITRLQEEKASFRMEALQYLRLMEEQAEYDTEALERANNLLSEKENELQDLETELEFYRNNIVEKEKELQDLETEMELYRNNIVEESVVTHCTENNPRASTNDSKSSDTTKSNGNCNPMNSSAPPNLADEKLYISQCLNKLEKKLHQAYCSRKLDMSNGMDSGNMKNVHDVVILPPDLDLTLTLEMEEKTLSSQNCMSASNATPEHEKENGHASEKGSRLSANYGGINCSDFEKEMADLHERPEALEISSSDFEKENGHASEKGLRLSANYSGINCSDFEKEIADLHERPEALEINQDFLKRVSNLLQNGKDGSQLIHERAHHSRERREAEFSER